VVDEDAGELGVGELQADAREQEDGEQDETRPLGPQVRRDEVAIEAG
jgi:hypothetical protein